MLTYSTESDTITLAELPTSAELYAAVNAAASELCFGCGRSEDRACSLAELLEKLVQTDGRFFSLTANALHSLLAGTDGEECDGSKNGNEDLNRNSASKQCVAIN
jgi:hypothetical protein